MKASTGDGAITCVQFLIKCPIRVYRARTNGKFGIALMEYLKKGQIISIVRQSNF
jgi:hypothetical protein